MAGRAQQPASVPPSLQTIEDALTDAIEKASRSVVSITRVRRAGEAGSLNFEIRPGPFGLRAMPPTGSSSAQPRRAPGDFATGVVVDAGGLIVTAYHVLRKDSDYYVVTPDRRRHRAWIKAADPRSDLAVLAIDATDLVPIALGDAAKLRRGQIVIALGNPYAIAADGQASASWGIVANLNRVAPPSPTADDPVGKTSLHHFGTLIQTDARLNLGTSGGALVDLQGRMVGLTTSLAATAGYETAAGYAYPVDDLFRRVLNTMKQGREVEYGFLGVQPIDLSPQEIVAGQRGVRVARVERGSRAETFGLVADDVIRGVNGHGVDDANAFVLAVGRLPVEAKVRLAVVRDDRPSEFNVALSKYPVRGEKIVTAPQPGWRGLKVDYTTAVVEPELRRAMGGRFFDDRLVAVAVKEESPAWQAGIRPGHLISHVQGRPVRTPAEFRAAVAGKTGPVHLRYITGTDGQQHEAVVAGP